MRLIIAILLVLVTLPGGGELVESVAQMVEDAQDHDDGACEHACTPLRHHCSCHSTMSGQPAQRHIELGSLRTVRTSTFAFASIIDGRCAEPPPVRPPIA